MISRRRKAIGLSLAEAAKLTGIEQKALAGYEANPPTERVLYDHAVVLARALGILPSEMPGIRHQPDKAPRDPVADLEQAYAQGPVVTLEGAHGERFGGDIERVFVTPTFALKITDGAFAERFAKGATLGFVGDPKLKIGDVALIFHRRTRALALRAFLPPSYEKIASWQPSYVANADWSVVGRLQIVLLHR